MVEASVTSTGSLPSYIHLAHHLVAMHVTLTHMWTPTGFTAGSAARAGAGCYIQNMAGYWICRACPHRHTQETHLAVAGRAGRAGALLVHPDHGGLLESQVMPTSTHTQVTHLAGADDAGRKGALLVHAKHGGVAGVAVQRNRLRAPAARQLPRTRV